LWGFKGAASELSGHLRLGRLRLRANGA